MTWSLLCFANTVKVLKFENKKNVYGTRFNLFRQEKNGNFDSIAGRGRFGRRSVKQRVFDAQNIETKSTAYFFFIHRK